MNKPTWSADPCCIRWVVLVCRRQPGQWQLQSPCLRMEAWSWGQPVAECWSPCPKWPCLPPVYGHLERKQPFDSVWLGKKKTPNNFKDVCRTPTCQWQHKAIRFGASFHHRGPDGLAQFVQSLWMFGRLKIEQVSLKITAQEKLDQSWEHRFLNFFNSCPHL